MYADDEDDIEQLSTEALAELLDMLINDMEYDSRAEMRGAVAPVYKLLLSREDKNATVSDVLDANADFLKTIKLV